MMEEQERPLVGEYTGTTGGFFGLCLRTAFFSILTVGIYRFWARTRIRRYIWSATSPGGDPFEYTGTGLEKLLGFLMALVILGVVLGLMQLGLFYAGLSFFNGASDEQALAMQIAALQASFVVILPLILVAQYRARRYMLSRTRWRGIRFGMENGAVGYMLRAIGHSILTGITLGILLPRQTYYLQKYKLERTWYGDKAFKVGGSWKELWPAMLNFLIGFVIMVLGGIAMAFNPIAAVLFFVGYVWFFIGIISYKVWVFRIMAGLTTLDGRMVFKALPSVMTVFGKLILGGFLVSILATVVFMVLGGLVAAIGINFENPEELGNSPAVLVVIGLGALLAMALIGAASKAFVVQPIIRHFVTSTAVMNPSYLTYVHQREGADQVDADGFADALDVGAAI